MPQADAVFEGGGVRGIAHAGALVEAEAAGYTWENVAGTSAGSIIAALVACGYTGQEVREIIWSFDFSELMDNGWEDRLGDIALFPLRFVPRFGKVAPYIPSILKDFGIYEGDRFQEEIGKYLEKRARRSSATSLSPDWRPSRNTDTVCGSSPRISPPVGCSSCRTTSPSSGLTRTSFRSRSRCG